jgi:hypothetical protein
MILHISKSLKLGTLKEALKKSYGYDEDYSLKIIRETAENDKRVRARRNSYSRKINYDDIELRRI